MRTVFVAEDVCFAELCLLSLQERGLVGECCVLGSGTELRAYLASEKPVDLVIVEELLPDMDAMPLLEDICRQPALERPLVMVLCLRCNLMLWDRFLPADGSAACLSLPFLVEDLARRVEFIQREWLFWRARKALEALYRQWNGDPDDLAFQIATSVVLRMIRCEGQRPTLRKDMLQNAMEGLSAAGAESRLRRLIGRLEEAAAPAYLNFKDSAGLAGKRPRLSAFLDALYRHAKRACRERW